MQTKMSFSNEPILAYLTYYICKFKVGKISTINFFS